ncbi:protein FAM166B-like [Uloborus diversus]|uniref:protein FAM166B-like n=1 Tax=Uloborus diversus TaxID=327109 RepID=UPI002409E951|nr:protein FAM166B-like [Uloborus diversus]
MSTDEKIKKPFIKPDLTPQPHFIPGYTGFCPELPLVVGSSYGRVTSEILQRHPRIAGRLKPTEPQIAQPIKVEEQRFRDQKLNKVIINSRVPAVGRRVLNDYMMPGYCGHVPNSTDIVGENFTRGCVSAIAKFAEDQLKMRNKN